MENSERPHELRLVPTPDGSYTIWSEHFGSHYHSKHGAKTESERIFIELGLKEAAKKTVSNDILVFELGLGTALNVALALQFATERKQAVKYLSIEKFPLPSEMIKDVNVEPEQLTLLKLNPGVWHQINPYFNFRWEYEDWVQYKPIYNQLVDVFFWDPFAIDDQAEMWTIESIRKAIQMLKTGGILTTYSAAGWFRKALAEEGCIVKRESGPPWKRHVTVAIKK